MVHEDQRRLAGAALHRGLQRGELAIDPLAVRPARPHRVQAAEVEAAVRYMQAGALGRGSTFIGPKLSNADLSGARFSQSRFWNATLVAANCRNTIFAGAQMRNADLTGAQLDGASFEGADLRGAKLPAGALGIAAFDGADLDGVEFVTS